MDRKKLLIHIVVLMFLLFLLNRLAFKFFLYYTIWWFDILMHLGAGFWVGLFFLYVFSPKVSSFKVVLNIILWVLLIALLWELFELIVYNFIGEIPFDTLDTIGDIFFGLTGGFLAVFYYFKKVTPTEGKLL